MMEEAALLYTETKDFQFPIRLALLRDPTIAKDVYSCKRDAIVPWIVERGKSLVTQQSCKPLYLQVSQDDNQCNGHAAQQGSLSTYSGEHDGPELFRLLREKSCKTVKSLRSSCYRHRCRMSIVLLSTLLFLLCGLGLHLMYRCYSGRSSINAPSSSEMSLSPIAVPSTVQSKYSSAWTKTSSKYCPTSCSIPNHYYEVFEINVVVASNYDFAIESTVKISSYIYNNSFHPSQPLLNLLSKNDNSGGNMQFKLTAFLRPWTRFILVATTFSPNVTGAFSVVASGPTTVGLRRLMVPSFWKSIYSSEWTTRSQTYCRQRCPVSDYTDDDIISDDNEHTLAHDYYYEAIPVSVSTAGNFSLASVSDVDTYGYIYYNNFDPSNPSLHLFSEDDNSDGSGQFKLTVFLRPGTQYVLVATTFAPHSTGNFSIIANGPSFVKLIRAASTSQTTTETMTTPSIVQSTYSVILTTDSQIFCRSDCLIPDHYYEATEITVNTTGSYRFTSKSSIDTYAFIYSNTFNPSHPSENVLSHDDDGGNSLQFKLTAFLRAGSTYVLVVTTYSPGMTGSLSITGSGPESVAFRPPINPRTTTTVETTTLSIMQSSYSSMLTTDSQIFCRSNCLVPDYYYQAIEITVNTTGPYRFTSESNIDTYGLIYENTFNPFNLSVNMLSYNDDGSAGSQFELTTSLQAELTYVLVVTTYSPRVTGRLSIVATGPALVNFVRATTARTTTTATGTTTKTTTPWSVQSTYSSAWTTQSQSYCRTSCSVSKHYYYEAIQVSVSVAASFSLGSKSNVDTYGYIYSNSFDPSYPSLNLLLQDDEGSNNGQFKLTYYFEPESTYVLVATTYYPNTTGSFSISASGPGSVTFH